MSKKKKPAKDSPNFWKQSLDQQVIDRFNEIRMPVDFFTENPGTSRAFGEGGLLIVRRHGKHLEMSDVSLQMRREK